MKVRNEVFGDGAVLNHRCELFQNLIALRYITEGLGADNPSRDSDSNTRSTD